MNKLFSILFFIILIPGFLFAQADTASLRKMCQFQGSAIYQKFEEYSNKDDKFNAALELTKIDVSDTLYLNSVLYAAEVLSDTSIGIEPIKKILNDVQKYFPYQTDKISRLRILNHLVNKRLDSVIYLTGKELELHPANQKALLYRVACLNKQNKQNVIAEEVAKYLPYNPSNGDYIIKLVSSAFLQGRMGQVYAYALYGAANAVTAQEARMFIGFIEEALTFDAPAVPANISLPAINNLDDYTDILQSRAVTKSSYKYRGGYSNYSAMKQIDLFISLIKKNKYGEGTFLEKAVLPYLIEIEKEEQWSKVFGYCLYLIADGDKGKKSEFQKWIDWRKKYFETNPLFNTVTYQGKEYTVKFRNESNNREPSVLLDKSGSIFEGKEKCIFLNGNGFKVGEVLVKPNTDVIDGKFITYYTNGEIEAEKFMYDGKLEGVLKTFSRNGIQLSEQNTKNDIEEGYQQLFHGTGARRSTYGVAKDKLHGVFMNYHFNGKLRDSLNYVYGERDGKFVSYENDGSLSAVSFYKKGKVEGEIKRYWSNGNLRSSEFYKNNVQEGKEVNYFKNGRINSIINYKNGVPVDTAKYYNLDGTIDYIIFVTNLEKESYTEIQYYDQRPCYKLYKVKGEYTKFEVLDAKGKVTAKREKLDKGPQLLKISHPSGYPIKEMALKNGLYDGVTKYFYQNGTISSEISYKEGRKNGPAKYFFANEKLNSYFNYVDGREEGLAYTMHPATETVASAAWYESGNLNGYKIQYSAEGKLDTKTSYLNDEKNGVSVDYNTATGTTEVEAIADSDFEVCWFYYKSANKYDRVSIFDKNPNVKLTDSTGKVYREFTLKNGHKEGDYKTYVNGKVNFEGKFNAGILVGKCKYDGFPINDSRTYEYNKFGDMIGTYAGTSPMGNSYKYTYFLEKDSVYYEFFDEKGKLVDAYGELNNNVYGERKMLDPTTGMVQVFLYYGLDEQIIAYAEADAQNKPKAKIMIKPTDKLITTNFSNGKKAFELEILNGIRHGKLTKYFANGKQMAERNYVNNKIHGLSLNFYPTGVKAFEEQYVNGSDSGKETSYYENGKVKLIRNYNNDDLQGMQKAISPTGKETIYNVFNDIFYFVK